MCPTLHVLSWLAWSCLRREHPQNTKFPLGKWVLSSTNDLLFFLTCCRHATSKIHFSIMLITSKRLPYLISTQIPLIIVAHSMGGLVAKSVSWSEKNYVNADANQIGLDFRARKRNILRYCERNVRDCVYGDTPWRFGACARFAEDDEGHRIYHPSQGLRWWTYSLLWDLELSKYSFPRVCREAWYLLIVWDHPY